jgi:uncharacterized repeat protein (TIGR03803 family)
LPNFIRLGATVARLAKELTVHRLSLSLLLAASALAFTPALWAQTESVVYSFTSGGKGYNPSGNLTLGSDGNFYGTTYENGADSTFPCSNDGGCGFAFRVTAAGALTVLHTFTNQNGDGANPMGGLIQGSDGNFYGTTEQGGGNFGTDGNCQSAGCGVVFKVTTGGTYSTVHDFTGASNDGACPCTLMLGSDGNFYGTSNTGGANSWGSIFKLTASGTFSTLYSFTSGAGGRYPSSALLEQTAGTFYGTAEGGTGSGVFFKFTTSDNKFTVLYTFTGGDDGAGPSALTLGSDGNFYGTASGGGEDAAGTIFRLTPAGAETTLYPFTGGKDGAEPLNQGLVAASDGNFYGATYENEADDFGTAFSITPGKTFTTLYAFNGAAGENPASGLIQGNSGDLYGVTAHGGNSDDCTGGCGVVYKVMPAVALPAPVQVTLSPTTVSPNSATTISWQVLNAFSATMQQCYASVQGGVSGAGAWTGKQTGSYSSSTKLYTGSAKITPTEAGTYTYALTCGGIESGFATLTVSGSSKDASTTTLTATPNPATVGQSVSLKATVTGSGATPAGRVTYDVTTIVLGSESLSSGVATLTASSNGQAPGIYPIVATYAGSSTYDASSSKPLNVTLNKAPTSTTISASPTTVTPPGDATLTATVKRSTSGAMGVPTGTVSFTVEGVTLDTVKVNGSGVATLKASSSGIAAGNYPIKAVYNGDASDVTSTSAAVTVTVK